MTSLRASLPRPGSSGWRKDRGTASSDGQENRVRHVVIRDAQIVKQPSQHVAYKINVLTQWNHWSVLRRYSEFYALHQQLILRFGLAKDMLPPKRLTGNLSPALIEKRREALEHYLQRLVNSHEDVAMSSELVAFLDVHSHDVVQVARSLTEQLYRDGDGFLTSGAPYTFTPTEMFCISKRLRLPNSGQDQPDGSLDLGHLYSFVHEVRSVRVSAPRSHPSSCNMPFNVSHFRSLQQLEVDRCPLVLVEGLGTMKAQMEKLSAHHVINNLRVLIEEAAVEKRHAVQASQSVVQSWRQESLTSLTGDRFIVQPWLRLTHLDVSHNRITSLDNSLALLPCLMELNLSYNLFQTLDLSHVPSVGLRKLSMAHNRISLLSPSKGIVRDLEQLDLSHNRLHKLQGIESVIQLRQLDLRRNFLATVEEMNCLSHLSELRGLQVADNPMSQKRSHRGAVFAKLHKVYQKLVLDGGAFGPADQARLQKLRDRYGSQMSSWPEGAFRHGNSVLSAAGAGSLSTSLTTPNGVPAARQVDADDDVLANHRVRNGDFDRQQSSPAFRVDSSRLRSSSLDCGVFVADDAVRNHHADSDITDQRRSGRLDGQTMDSLRRSQSLHLNSPSSHDGRPCSPNALVGARLVDWSRLSVTPAAIAEALLALQEFQLSAKSGSPSPIPSARTSTPLEVIAPELRGITPAELATALRVLEQRHSSLSSEPSGDSASNSPTMDATELIRHILRSTSRTSTPHCTLSPNCTQQGTSDTEVDVWTVDDNSFGSDNSRKAAAPVACAQLDLPGDFLTKTHPVLTNHSSPNDVLRRMLADAATDNLDDRESAVSLDYKPLFAISSSLGYSEASVDIDRSTTDDTPRHLPLLLLNHRQESESLQTDTGADLLETPRPCSDVASSSNAHAELESESVKDSAPSLASADGVATSAVCSVYSHHGDEADGTEQSSPLCVATVSVVDAASGRCDGASSERDESLTDEAGGSLPCLSLAHTAHRGEGASQQHGRNVNGREDGIPNIVLTGSFAETASREEDGASCMQYEIGINEADSLTDDICELTLGETDEYASAANSQIH